MATTPLQKNDSSINAPLESDRRGSMAEAEGELNPMETKGPPAGNRLDRFVSDPIFERKLVRRLDLITVPMMILIYFFSYECAIF